ncbi:hypothetical protein CMUS01_06111 [Colletotrichum musicola]|uniref:Heterokaryon incompatibility domain-containing protein n=1 Tax=Colletotrichum musicola TaxID=2175873 RepID=A0A8H6KNV8_9PEZI|nr:hypothetical protein CMUS01_06111 [Colletotrichum musicola]
MMDRTDAPEPFDSGIGSSHSSTTGRQLQLHKRLCKGCRALDLSVECFKVQGSSKRTSRDSASAAPSLRSYTSPHQLGSLAEIRKRSSECELCALVTDSVEEEGSRVPLVDDFSAKAGHDMDKATCSISWEIDGREAPKRSGHNPANLVRGITRRMHLRWDSPRLSDAYLVYVAPDKFARTASDADRVWAKDSMFLGRNITQDVENQALIRSWLDLCEKSHKGPCRQRNEEHVDRFVEMVSHSYFGVIDVQNMQLTQLPCETTIPEKRDSRRSRRPEPYVALSYVWGDEKAYTTLTENVMLHRMHGGLEDVLLRLPKAIQDAIDLVRRLGFRYMWIDRLCIVQNSSRSWKLNAYNMDLIYGNAALTICAADGDATVGLRAIRPQSRNTKQYKRSVAPGLELMVTRPPEIYIRASEWNERAWTFQERLLSRRCLIFTNGRVYFQCRSTGMSEDIFGDQKGAGWSLDLVDAPLQMFRQLENRAFWVYMKSVELYTERKLTQAKDIQAAFSGMANMMEERMAAPFIHGLPSSHFDLALLWEPVKSMRRRKTSDQTSDHLIPDFPSWSWTGWVGETKYHDDLTGGILDNVSQWLDTHTWIQWWVRDGHGDLRPLWDNVRSREDLSSDANWRGYTERRGMGRGRGRDSCGSRAYRHRRRSRSRSRSRKHTYKSFRREIDPDHIRRLRVEDEVKYERNDEFRFDRVRPPPPPPALALPAPPKMPFYDERPVMSDAAPPHPTHDAAFYDMFFEDNEKEFNITLRDYPYRVVKAPFNPKPETSEFPLLPILQFRTWHTWLHIKQSAPPRQQVQDRKVLTMDAGSSTGLARYHIADEVGDWCGSIVLDAEWAAMAGERQEFIAISEAKCFTLAECPEWTYYIPKEREQSEWDLFYVLLVERKEEKWERVGVGKVFKEAFHSSKQREIMLS